MIKVLKFGILSRVLASLRFLETAQVLALAKLSENILASGCWDKSIKIWILSHKDVKVLKDMEVVFGCLHRFQKILLPVDLMIVLLKFGISE